MYRYFCTGFIDFVFIEFIYPEKFYKFVLTTQFLKEWWSDSELFFEIECTHVWDQTDFSSIR